MTAGTFKVARSVWGHHAFRDEPKTQREAWIWMLSEASWKARVTRAGELIVPLDRGQLVGSFRFLAGAWRWTDSKVRRFLEKLEKLKMIRLETDAGVTVITICNYDDFQGDGATTDAGPTQDRRRTDANYNKDEIREEGKEEIDHSPPSDGDVPRLANDASQAVTRYNAAAEKAGWPQVQKLNPNRAKLLRARLADSGGLEGWEVALRKAFDSDFLRGRTPKPWTGFSFDWLIKSANFTKLMEGNYDNRSTGPSFPGQSQSASGGRPCGLAGVAARRAAQRRE